ncbi:MAG TPA: multiheme c-type cytochrome [Terriglobales bacterium]|nr:multiheme c-type cytochrome [Terriglobales bacterium]
MLKPFAQPLYVKVAAPRLAVQSGLLALLIVFVWLPAFAQVPATIADQMTSDEHLAKPGWWPRKGDAQRSDYVGAKVCAECHADLVRQQQQHAMAHASMPVSEADHLDPPGKFDLGPYHFSIGGAKNGATYSVSDGAQTFTAPVLWAVGSGTRGQSYLFERDGDLYEARISFFRGLGFNITPDHPTTVPDSLEHAIGRKINTGEAPNCLGCHATAAVVSGKVDSAHMIPGISCEGCHGPGTAHVALARAGTSTNPGMIFNPAHLDAATSVDFCGSCHRTWWDINQLGYRGIQNIRFPAYRLEGSRCWGKGDPRITCAACHDPHKPLVTELPAYDDKCLSCHVKSASMTATADHPGRGCPVGKNNCASCHMQKYQLGQMHAPFTDHRIRIVRDAKVFPDE